MATGQSHCLLWERCLEVFAVACLVGSSVLKFEDPLHAEYESGLLLTSAVTKAKREGGRGYLRYFPMRQLLAGIGGWGERTEVEAPASGSVLWTPALAADATRDCSKKCVRFWFPLGCLRDEDVLVVCYVPGLDRISRVGCFDHGKSRLRLYVFSCVCVWMTWRLAGGKRRL